MAPAVNPFRTDDRDVSRLPRDPSETGCLHAPQMTLRQLTGFEEEFIEANTTGTNPVRLANEVLAMCLDPPGSATEKSRRLVGRLLVADRDAALIRLRRQSIGDVVETEVPCPYCEETNGIRFDLGQIPTDFTRPEKRIRVELNGGQIAELRHPTADDQQALLDENLQGAARRRSWLLARLLLRFGDREGPFDLAFSRSLSSAVRNALESAVDASVPSLDLRMRAVCYACERSFFAPFDVSGFFLPS